MKSFLDLTKKFEREQGLKVTKDQFFVINPEILAQMVDTAGVDKNDCVLEVGPGLGFLTQVLAHWAKEVLTIETDERFRPYLATLPQNVEVIYGDAYKLLNDRNFLRRTKPPTKTVSNIPYSQAQNMLHNYTNWSWYQGGLVWLAPLSLVNKVNREPILSAYFKAELIKEVPRSDFYPQPHTISAIILFKRIPDPQETGDFRVYFRRWLYKHENQKVKNALKEGLIGAAYDLKGVRVTKNQAQGLIESLNIPPEHTEALTNNIRPQYYFEIPEKLLAWFNSIHNYHTLNLL